MYNLSHIKKNDILFSLQNDEALCMYSLTKLIDPAVIVEFGFYEGFSSKNFLAAMSKDSYLYSYDPDLTCNKFAHKIRDRRFTFVNKKGEDFDISDIKQKRIDFVLIDAAHNFESNIKIFNKINTFIFPGCILAVHDTGLFNEDKKEVKWRTPNGFLIGRGYAHQPHERVFINYLHRNFSEYQQIHLHSMRVGRMGMTLLQKYNRLDDGNIGNKIVWNYLLRKNIPIKVRKIIKKAHKMITFIPS